MRATPVDRMSFHFGLAHRVAAIAPIQRIADQRMAKMLKVHADLMRATRFQPARQP